MPHDNESTESAQGGPDGLCNAIDPDDDGDGFPDPLDEDNIVCNADLCEDAFKWDHTEWHDADADGAGDNSVALELMDDIRAEPGPFAMAGLAVILGIVAIRRMGAEDEDYDDYDEDADMTDMLDDDLEDAIDEAFDDEDEAVSYTHLRAHET